MPNDKLLSYRIEERNPSHVTICVFQNGGGSGRLTFDARKADEILAAIDAISGGLEAALRKQEWVVARALHLYRYNVPAAHRITRWWEERFPNMEMRQEDADKWYDQFGGDHQTEVPLGMDPKSHRVYVKQALEKYREECEREYDWLLERGHLGEEEKNDAVS